jgi:SAM-dependent methyltransferase
MAALEPSEIIGLASWLKTPPGQYLLAWEQALLDKNLADVFGFHALQLGLPELQALRENRMPHRWLATDIHANAGSAAVLCDFDALPFDSLSLDLVVLPHTLELSTDPHRALREVERVLRPEGRVVVLGLNPASSWGVRQYAGRLMRRLGCGTDEALFLPNEGEFIAYRRLRDWLQLLSFDIDVGHFGCYLPPLSSRRWLARLQWLEACGERWWPVLGAVYCVVAVKRVRGMRLVGLVPRPFAKIKPNVHVATKV